MALLPLALLTPLLAPLRRLAARGWLREADVDGLLRHAHPLASLNRHYARVEARYWVADDMLALALRTAPGWPPARPGQHIQLLAERDGVRVGRSYSLTRVVGERLEIAVKRHPDGLLSPWLCEHLAVGQRVELQPAQGDLRWPMQAEAVYLLAAGSSLTPLLGLLREALENGYRGPVLWLHYVRHPGQRAWLGELEALAARHPNLELRWSLTRGARADGCLEGHFQPRHLDGWAADLARSQALACGPAAFVEAVGEQLGHASPACRRNPSASRAGAAGRRRAKCACASPGRSGSLRRQRRQPAGTGRGPRPAPGPRLPPGHLRQLHLRPAQRLRARPAQRRAVQRARPAYPPLRQRRPRRPGAGPVNRPASPAMRDDRELTPEQLAAFGAELDALRLRTLADLGADDARYIRRVRAAVRVCCWSGRALLMFGWLPPTWLLGSLLLGLGKILENMELGHNVMHGQYDWMNDPEFAGRAYEWDIAGPSDFWRHTHNHIHHTYTNVLGKDDDVGYGVVRLFPEQRWKPFYRWQPLWVTLQALLFQYAVAIQHLRLDKYAKGRLDKAELMPLLRRLRAKLGRQWTKDYLLFPLLGLFAGGFGAVFVGNLLANVLRNLWTFTVIFCGHFTEKAVVFPPSVLEGETRGHWYLRQLRGSSNLEGGPLFHILTGNLSHQIEHHLYPDLPARRYAALSREVREIARRYGQTYNSGRLGRQFLTVLRRIWVYRLPPREPLPAGRG